MKNKFLVVMALMVLLVGLTMTSALPEVKYVKIDGDVYEDGEQLVAMRGETIDIRVKIFSNHSDDNIKVEAYLDGYEYDDYQSVRDSAHTFDMDAGDTEYVDLSIDIPERAEKDYYDLKVRVGTRRGASDESQYRINLKGQKHELIIKDILMTDSITAGRGLFANVKIKNIGQKDEDDVTIRFEIPELGISEFTTIDEIEMDSDGETVTSEDIVAFIEECVEPGEYEVIVKVQYDEYEQITKTETLTVRESSFCQKDDDASSRTVVSVPQAQDVVTGESAVFPIMLTNQGSKAQTYIITVSNSVDAFGTVRIDPSNVLIVKPNTPETVFIYVTPNKGVSEGAKDFKVTIQTGDESQDIALTANVVKGSTSSDIDLKNALELGLVILIVILVIIGIIVGFNKLKPKESEESDEELGQTYY